jgi:CHAD domain-containing protein
MAFCFKKRESVRKGIHRIGRERIDHMRECMSEGDCIEAIHCARKDIKKVRAVMRMVRTKLRKKDFDRINDLLREAAEHLAAPRDAYVRTVTLKRLSRHFKGQLAPDALRHIRAELRARCDKEMKRFAKAEAAKTAERIRRRVAREWNGLKVSGKGWKTLCPGVEAAYLRGQDAFQSVSRDSSPENFHHWRKRAKDLWYQITMLRRLWPEQMEAIAHELETLSERLGDDHDLDVLRQSVEEEFGDEANPREVATLNALIEQRQRELRTAALALGARFYAEKPSAFCGRLANYWQVWRRERTPGIEAAERGS